MSRFSSSRLALTLALLAPAACTDRRDLRQMPRVDERPVHDAKIDRGELNVEELEVKAKLERQHAEVRATRLEARARVVKAKAKAQRIPRPIADELDRLDDVRTSAAIKVRQMKRAPDATLARFENEASHKLDELERTLGSLEMKLKEPPPPTNPGGRE